MERFERERAELEQKTRSFFFDGELTEALQLFAHQMAILLVILEDHSSNFVTPLSTVWANSTVQELVSQFPTQPADVIAVRVDPKSVDGRFLKSLFKVSTDPVVLGLGGDQNLLIPGVALTPEIVINVILRLKEDHQTPAFAEQHKNKGEWLIQQLLLNRGTLSPNDFVADSSVPAPALAREFIATSMTGLPSEAFDDQSPTARALLRAQQELEYEQALSADQAQEAETTAAANKAAKEKEEAEMQEAMALSVEIAKHEHQTQKRQLLPPEPQPDEMPGLATIVFRIQGQNPMTRRFRPGETVQDLHDFLFVEKGIEECRFIVMGLGPGALDDRSLTVAAAKLAPKTQIMVSCEAESDSDSE